MTSRRPGRPREESDTPVKGLGSDLAEDQETLRAIKSGEVDAIVVNTPHGERVFTLRGADEPYRVLFEQMNEGALIVSDLGTVLYSNLSFAATLKLSLERIIGIGFDRLILPVDRQNVRRALDMSRQGKSKVVATFNADDGTLVPMQLSISDMPGENEEGHSFCIVATDLTERTKAEESLRRANDELELRIKERTHSLETMNEKLKAEIIERLLAERQLVREKERLLAMLKSIADAVIASDSKWNISIMNQKAEKLTGWKQTDALGRSLHEVFRVAIDDLDRGKEAMDVWHGQLLGQASDRKLSLTTKDGSIRTVLVSAAPVRDSDGASLGMIIVFRPAVA